MHRMLAHLPQVDQQQNLDIHGTFRFEHAKHNNFVKAEVYGQGLRQMLPPPSPTGASAEPGHSQTHRKHHIFLPSLKARCMAKDCAGCSSISHSWIGRTLSLTETQETSQLFPKLKARCDGAKDCTRCCPFFRGNCVAS